MTSVFSKVGKVICKSDWQERRWVDDLKVLWFWSGLVWGIVWLGVCKRISCLSVHAFLVCFVFSHQPFDLLSHEGSTSILESSLSVLAWHILLPSWLFTDGSIQACNPVHPESKPFVTFYHMSINFLAWHWQVFKIWPWLCWCLISHSSARLFFHKMRLPTVLWVSLPPFCAFVPFLSSLPRIFFSPLSCACQGIILLWLEGRYLCWFHPHWLKFVVS